MKLSTCSCSSALAFLTAWSPTRRRELAGTPGHVRGCPYVNDFRRAFSDLARDERVQSVPFLLEGLDKREQFLPDNLSPHETSAYSIPASAIRGAMHSSTANDESLDFYLTMETRL